MVVLETCQFGGRKGAVFLLPYIRIIKKKKKTLVMFKKLNQRM